MRVRLTVDVEYLDGTITAEEATACLDGFVDWGASEGAITTDEGVVEELSHSVELLDDIAEKAQ